METFKERIKVMKEGKMNTDDGDEFNVFWLGGSQNKPDKPDKEGCTDSGVSGCCPVGPKGEQGPEGKKDAPWESVSLEKKEDFLKKIMHKIKNPIKEIQIDDQIPSDVVSDPRSGAIYKVTGVNVIVRFVCCEYSGTDTKFELDFHGTRLYINKGDEVLVKATEYEVELYNLNE